MIDGVQCFNVFHGFNDIKEQIWEIPSGLFRFKHGVHAGLRFHHFISSRSPGFLIR